MLKKITFGFVLLLLPIFVFAQMDMLPQLLRDLPPEMQEGIPENMTYKEYRQLNRNIDFFTMFMSMFVPGYGLFQVEKPGLAAGVIAGRTAGYALMGIGVGRQWNDLQDLGRLSDISQNEFDDFILNAALFGGGMILNGIGWALDVMGAYHISKKEKDFVIYKYGLQKEIGARGEAGLISYIRQLKLQFEDKQAAIDLGDSLERFITLYPFSEYAPEAEYYLLVHKYRNGDAAGALLHAGRSAFLYPDSKFQTVVRQTGVEIVQKEAVRWDKDVVLLMKLADKQKDETKESAYFRFLSAVSQLHHNDFVRLFPAESYRFLTLFPDSAYIPKVLFLRGSHFSQLKAWKEAVIEYVKCGALYPEADIASSALMKGADILNEKLDRPAHAIKYYQSIISAYPDTSEAAGAMDKLKALDSGK